MRANRIRSDDSFEYLALHGFASKHPGFASKYLHKTWDEDKVENRADIDEYKKFLEIDSQAGVSMTEQFFFVVKYTFRQDLLKVI